jgi:hypothetical protein
MASHQAGQHQNKAQRHGCKETQPDQRRAFGSIFVLEVRCYGQYAAKELLR